MLYKIPEIGERIQSFFTELHQSLAHEVKRMIEEQLEQEVDAWLYRNWYERREHVKRRSQGSCQKCGSQKACQFLRNGYRDRQLVTQLGVINFRLPRVRCECGGSVQIPFSIMKPYQQIWDDVVDQIQRWADLGLSLRQMQSEIGGASRHTSGLTHPQSSGSQCANSNRHPVE